MKNIEFKINYIDIVRLLNSPVVLGEYRGREVWLEINNQIESLPDGTLVWIDIEQALFINTAFFEPAFGPIFKTSERESWLRKYVMFQMKDMHKPGFYQGVLKYCGKDVPRREAEAQFINSEMYAKVIEGKRNQINFVGNLDNNEHEILDVVNKIGEANAKQVVEVSNLTEEITVDTLRSLRDKHFIVEHENKSNKKCHYYSFYKYVEEKII